MARSFVYIVSENPEVMEKVKKSTEGQDVSFFTYSGPQWREGMENPFFRSQLVNGVPSLNIQIMLLVFQSQQKKFRRWKTSNHGLLKLRFTNTKVI
jgi:hypothetical protein